MRYPNLRLLSPDPLTEHRELALLRLENDYLRGRLESRGRIEADPELKADLDRSLRDNRRKDEQLQIARAQVERLQGVHTELRLRIGVLETARSDWQQKAIEHKRLLDQIKTPERNSDSAGNL